MKCLLKSCYFEQPMCFSRRCHQSYYLCNVCISKLPLTNGKYLKGTLSVEIIVSKAVYERECEKKYDFEKNRVLILSNRFCAQVFNNNYA